MLWPSPPFSISSSACFPTVRIISISISTYIMVTGVDSGYYERMLLRDLMENYQKLERPVSFFFTNNIINLIINTIINILIMEVMNEADAVNLTFGLTLQQIIDVVRKTTTKIP